MEGMTLEKLQVIIEAQTKAYYEELKKVQQQTKSATSAVETQTEKINPCGLEMVLENLFKFSCQIMKQQKQILSQKASWELP